MILRSGLVENREGIDAADFRSHWLKIHGPLAKALPGLRRYSQNHVVARLPAAADATLHPIDGLSQLYYDDIPSMVRACDSPENQRCIEDIRGYFSHVTVLVLDPKVVAAGSPDWGAGRKVMMVLVGEDSATDDYRNTLSEFLKDKARGARYVHNVVIDRSHIVDKSVPHSTQVVTGLAELWFPDANALEQATKAGLLSVGLNLLQPAAAVVVEEHRIL